MFARSTTIQAQPSAIDAGIAHMRDEVMPVLAETPGCTGLSLLVDRTFGRCISTTGWESEAAMHDSESAFMAARDRAVTVFGGTAAQVAEWEIAVLHRDHRTMPGACVRVTWIKTDPSRLDMSTDAYRNYILPGMEQLDGFCSASLLINRASGRAVSCGVFDSAEAMQRNREQSAALRVDAARQVGVEAIDVREFELALAHLRVPELV
ncbi:antibiotic biosynthesis monooxygenase [Nocardia africana]